LLRDAISELPAEPSNRTRQAEIFLQRADKKFADGDYSKAITLYEEALLFQPDNSLIFLQLSQARMFLEPPQLDVALQDVNSAIERQPTLGQAWKQKGDIYMLLNNFPAAQDALQHAVGSLQGIEKVQAQSALAQCRLKSEQNSAIEMPAPQTSQTSPNAVSPLAVSPAGPASSQVPAISQPVQPGPQPSAPAASPPLTSQISLPERSASQNLNPPRTTPTQPVSLPSSAQSLTAGLAGMLTLSIRLPVKFSPL
jgi:tetratricopeptide (TPR) repeat protein